ncbi:uncharacterized protein LOC111911988 [Lactuca sativa]|uniref:uncharacterized protein LOC111911988 n=1 Tax=Lactuca sativa TaxID=4236 RepID=UPI000CD8666F|nr:uncharacterized protein LOC111911988 [Lactuca sativa]
MTGHEFTLELLHRNPLQCLEVLRLSRESFVRLCAHFRVNYVLKDSKHVSVEEKMVLFLMMIGHNQRYVIIKRRFQYSKQTIHKRLRRVFKGAVGALDGTLIHVVVPTNKHDLYRSSGKGECYQNVLAICDFNMLFTFVVAGWEGIAHDSRILSEALTNPHAPFPLPPPDKYYLCDVAYANIRRFMASYRNVRYWLGDFRRRRALTNKEKFNHAHAKLRNVIERAWCLGSTIPYTEEDGTILNNNAVVDNDEDEIPTHGTAADREYMTQLWDEIAEQLMQNME